MRLTAYPKKLEIQWQVFTLIPSLNSNRSINESITINQLVEKLTTPNPNVLQARQFGKGTHQYDSIKRTLIPAYYPNSLNDKSTGYFYGDIDGFSTQEEALSTKDYLNTLPFISMVWLSLSNKGLSFLVKVDSLTYDNYNAYWSKINEFLDGMLDTHSKGYNKVNCISYDSNLEFKPYAIPFDSFFRIEENKKGISSTIFRHSIIRTTDTFSEKDQKGVNYRTYLPDSEYQNINTPVIIPEGKQVLEINLLPYRHKKIPIGHRNATIGAISMQLIVLNPTSDKIRILNALQSINKNYCIAPLQKQEVRDIFNANYTKFIKEGLDISKYYKPKYIHWHKECQLHAHEKQSIGNQLLLKARGKGKEYTESLINDSIEILQDGKKITQQRVAEFTGLSLVTLKRYWNPFKELVKDYNQGLK